MHSHRWPSREGVCMWAYKLKLSQGSLHIRIHFFVLLFCVLAASLSLAIIPIALSNHLPCPLLQFAGTWKGLLGLPPFKMLHLTTNGEGSPILHLADFQSDSHITLQAACGRSNLRFAQGLRRMFGKAGHSPIWISKRESMT